ncbi:HAD family hydrolase [Paenactinomyces guangxiensis]|uniref:HAD family hydrolase n=1 Tax=Paenactinomyces guangxiensis TaxID=1490290 RepID=A0A7W1WPE4_9BACL|nr:HAD family hydrolase [Paenactinomyces guangxiensis]MBA4493644.1 HAD family hydrolase [Paenactinomyces guangxiensis]MBH8590931.1 HAD family hydrolase [Paenactinomyces guangxiensis]
MIRGVIFDFDGTIIDTETAAYETFCEIFQEYRIELPVAKWRTRVGTAHPGFNPYDYLEQCIGKPVDREALMKRKAARHQEKTEQMEVLPGVEKLLAAAKHAGLKLGVASNSPKSWVESHLDRIRLLSYFDCICTGDQVEEVKPDPALYYLALEKLGISSGEAIAVEDSPSGALAAKRAGLFCVLVPNPMTAEAEFAEDIDLRLESLADFDLEKMMQQWKHKLK